MNYTAIEIDKFAVKVSDDNHEGIVRYYDVREVSGKMLGKVDFFCGGSPCQGFSFSGKQLAFSDPRSVLFFEYVRLLKELLDINPDMQWMLENVQMKKEFESIITETLWGTKPIKVNSAIFSPQNRVRNYWCSWHINPLLFVDRERYLHHILDMDSGEEIKTYTPRDQESSSDNCRQVGMADTINGHDYLKRVYSPNAKAPTLTTMGGGNTEPKVALTEPQWNAASIRNRRLDENGVRKDDQLELPFSKQIEISDSDKSNCLTTFTKDNVLVEGMEWRKLTPIECERLQTVPDLYTQYGEFDHKYGYLGEVKPISNSQRYKMLGNGWTTAVIEHIFKGVKA